MFAFDLDLGSGPLRRLGWRYARLLARLRGAGRLAREERLRRADWQSWLRRCLADGRALMGGSR